MYMAMVDTGNVVILYIDDDLYNLIYPLVIIPIICFLYLRYFFFRSRRVRLL